MTSIVDQQKPSFPIAARRFVVLIMLGFSATPCIADEEAEATNRWLADKTAMYVDRTAGFTINLSRDFRLSTEQGDLLYFRSFERRGTLIIKPVPGLTLRNIQEVLRNGFDADSISLKTI